MTQQTEYKSKNGKYTYIPIGVDFWGRPVYGVKEKEHLQFKLVDGSLHTYIAESEGDIEGEPLAPIKPEYQIHTTQEKGDD